MCKLLTCDHNNTWYFLGGSLVNESLLSFCWASFEGIVSRCLGGGGLAEFLVLGMRLGLLVVFGAVVYTLLCRILRVREMTYALNLLRRLKAYVEQANTYPGWLQIWGISVGVRSAEK